MSVSRLLVALLALAPVGGSCAATDLTKLYAPFGQLLGRHVIEYDPGRGGLLSAFDYQAALEDPSSGDLLRAQDRALAAFDPAALNERAPAIAFWINAYNYFMIRHILNHPDGEQPVSSVRAFGSLFDPYRLFGRRLFDIGGTSYSLRQIEIEILLGDEFRRRGWKDARVHFAVNCASVSCPALRKTLYSAANLDELLAENTRRALATDLHLRVDRSTVFATPLFDWYGPDFIDAAGSIEAFILAHVDGPLADGVAQAGSIEFIDYDWRLNSPDNMRESMR